VLIEVRQPYVDVSAHDLSLTLGAPAARALETLELTIAGFEIELRLLGFSHQALIDGGAVLSEMVACVPGVAGSLPHRRTDGAYDFRARVERLEPEAYVARARDVLARTAAGAHSLAGVFAAAPDAGDPALPAFTALTARPLTDATGIAWTTWHGYPQTGEIVVTTSSLNTRRVA